MKNNENKKLNNKGFSLVELIIVIAIMAVLVGVLAPQYIKYVEKSRRSADGATVSEIAGAMQVLASDPDATLDTSKTYTYTNSGSTDNATLEASTELATLLTGYNVASSYKLKSADFKAATITLTLKYENNAWQYSESGVPAVN